MGLAGPGRAVLDVLVGVILAVLVMGTMPVAHDHDEPGVYDVECPLSRLAVAPPGVSLSAVPSLDPLAPAPEPVCAFDPGALRDIRLPSFEARAPPFSAPLSVRALTV